MKPIQMFLCVILSLLAFATASNVDGLVSILKDALDTWGSGLDCVFVCNNIAGRYMTLCPLACQRLGH